MFTKYFSFIFLSITCFAVIAQKPPIDFEAIDNWPSVSNSIISDNGKYFSFVSDKIPKGAGTLTVESTDKTLKYEFVGGAAASFSGDCNKFLFKYGRDTLVILTLLTRHYEYIGNVSGYKLIECNGEEWLVCHRNTVDHELWMRNLKTGNERRWKNVSNFNFSVDGTILIVQKEIKGAVINSNEVEWVNFGNNTTQTVWSSIDVSKKPSDFSLDVKGKQLVFVVEDTNSSPEYSANYRRKSIWYYNIDSGKASTIITNETPGIHIGVEIAGDPKFSNDGSRIFFQLKSKKVGKNISEKTLVDVWSYTDDKLQPQQLIEAKYPVYSTAVISINADSVILLAGPEERMDFNSNGTDDFAIIQTEPCYPEESYWRTSCKPSIYVVNTRTGKRRLIKAGTQRYYPSSLSPLGRFVVYFDYDAQQVLSYDLKTGKRVNIIKDIKAPLLVKENGKATPPGPYGGFANWFPNDRWVIIYDQYDIWQVDPAGIKPPICITNGYGRKNDIIFRLTYEGNIVDQRLLLNAFSPTTKENGFYRIDLNAKYDPELLTKGPYIYNWPSITAYVPEKAKNANVYLVRRMSEVEAPNYYITSDFKKYAPLTDIQPQKQYNWLTAELHEWTMLDGKSSKGILYKPEDFDPRKQYPVIFYFYEEKSDELHNYSLPEITGHHINIPHFVSNGYLVFVPDIYYTVGQTGESVYNAVASAARLVMQMPFVDKDRLGLQGHSFGGYEVNYLTTRTNMFAAAAEAAGPTNLVSKYNAVLSGGNSDQFQHETGQARIGATLWKQPELYYKNSPVLHADKIATPLLIMHNKEDDLVPFEQGVELFTSLRRLNKRCWMLQYDGFGHQIWGNAAKDYTIRLKQFFDHYLKNAPAPVWMSQGIPAKLKGIETRFELDPAGNCAILDASRCKVCDRWNEQFRSVPEMFTKPVSEWRLD